MTVSITVSNLKRKVKDWSKVVKDFKLCESSQKFISSTRVGLPISYDGHETLFDNFIHRGVNLSKTHNREVYVDQWRIEKSNAKV